MAWCDYALTMTRYNMLSLKMKFRSSTAVLEALENTVGSETIPPHDYAGSPHYFGGSPIDRKNLLQNLLTPHRVHNFQLKILYQI